MANPENPDHPCGNCAFYGQSVWRTADPGSIAVLRRGFLRKELDAGKVLFDQDEDSSGVFCVSTGLIALRTHNINGTSTLLRLAYPGDVIGFRSFLGDRPHQTEARAVLPSRVCTVARRDANRVVHGNPSVLADLSLRCLSEIDRNHERIIATATTSNKQRLSKLLVQLMEHHGQQTGDSLQMQLPLSRSDLADLIGVQPETLSRLVGRLERDGDFVISGREVRMQTTPQGPGKQTCAKTFPTDVPFFARNA